MDEDFAAFLEQVRAHRSEMGEAMRALDDALGLPKGLGQLWQRRVQAALTELCHDLRDHIELTESHLHADIRAQAPRLAGMVDSLQADHTSFLTEVERLLDQTSGPPDETGELAEAFDVDGHRAAVGDLLARLVRHRQRGSDLVYEAYVVDLGGSE